MGSHGSPETQASIAGNTRLFFDVMLRGLDDRACSIGFAPAFEGAWLDAKSDPTTGLAAACPPPIGLPEPDSLASLGCGVLVLVLLARRSARVRRRQRARRGSGQPGSSGLRVIGS